ncbi:hypothetical protein PoB_007655400 [Plakobranchus ocellatus]|uniref:Uncharacterized protein n=1 Tax=Plakobranchus ocellatus TaxID=259542 RepID=A0AAV4E0M1_9GAST|nr:hypothetical protein PoB_007655400 [Plakobranchus ocellatus]
MMTMTIYVDSNLRWRRMCYRTLPAYRARSVQWMTTVQAAAMYGLPSRTLSVFRTLGGSLQPGNGSTSSSPQPGDGSTSGSPQPPTRKLLRGFPLPRTLRTRVPCIDSAFDKALQNYVCLTVAGLCCDTGRSKISTLVAERRDHSVPLRLHWLKTDASHSSLTASPVYVYNLLSASPCLPQVLKSSESYSPALIHT